MYTDGMSKNKKVLIVALCILLGMGIWIVKARNNLTHVEGYRETISNGGACLAVSPECGVCYGKVIDSECYVDKKKLSAEELRAMNLTR